MSKMVKVMLQITNIKWLRENIKLTQGTQRLHELNKLLRKHKLKRAYYTIHAEISNLYLRGINKDFNYLTTFGASENNSFEVFIEVETKIMRLYGEKLIHLLKSGTDVLSADEEIVPIFKNPNNDALFKTIVMLPEPKPETLSAVTGKQFYGLYILDEKLELPPIDDENSKEKLKDMSDLIVEGHYFIQSTYAKTII